MLTKLRKRDCLTSLVGLLLLLTPCLSQAQITTYPYVENFEDGPAGWTVQGTTTTWELGEPKNIIISSAASGTMAWVTNLNGSYSTFENGAVESPVFDLTQLDDPVVEFSIRWDIEYLWDGAAVQYSIDDGANWEILGSANDPNWYNSSELNPGLWGKTHGFTGRSTSGAPSSWISVSHSLANLQDETAVIFRILFAADASSEFEGVAFDSFTIKTNDCPSAGTNGTLQTCGGVTDDDLFYALDGDPAVGGTWTYPAGDFGTYTYTVAASGSCPENSATVEVSQLPLAYAGEDALEYIGAEVIDLNDLLKSDPVTGKKPTTGGKWKDKETGEEIPTATVDFTNFNAGSYTRSYGYEVEGNCGSEDDSSVELDIFVPFDAGVNGILKICEGNSFSTVDLFNALGGNPDSGGEWNPIIDGPGVYTYDISGEMSEVEVIEETQLKAGEDGVLSIAIGTTVTEAMLYAALTGVKDEGGSWDLPMGGANVYTYIHDAATECPASTAKVTVTETTMSVNAPERIGLRLFPNPVTQHLFISGAVDDLNRIEIYSAQGQLIRRVEANFKRIDLSALSAAIYYVKLHANSGIATHVMLKK